MQKKLFSMFSVAMTVLVLAGCFETSSVSSSVSSSATSSATSSVSSSVALTYTVSFDTHGGSTVASQIVTKNDKATEPADPTIADSNGESYEFVGWYTDPSNSATAYNFESGVTANVTLHAVWATKKVVRYVTKTETLMDPVFLTANGGTVVAPAAPTREGYTFGGWYRGKAGLTWLDPVAVSFPFDTDDSVTLYAYWEPLNSKAVTYSDAETFFDSFTATTSTVLNPLVYQWSHESTLIGSMTTPLYSTEVDWGKAMADGVADYIGDFTKIEAAEYSIEALDYVNILIGATQFPVDSQGDDHTIDGKYNREGAAQIMDTSWTFHLRNDIYFEDGTKVTAETVEYSLKQYLDPAQGNSRSNSYYKDADNKQGYPIINASEYYKQTPENPVSWDTVGFEVVDLYTFKVKTYEAISQASAIGFGNISLVHPAAYAASLNEDGTDSTYGTAANPFLSYGPYLIKSWDENQRLVFNKNFKYVRKDTVTYKSIAYEFAANIDEQMSLFENGELSVVGLIGDYYTEYAENENVYRSWNGYPQYMIMNYAPSKLASGAYVKNSITEDERFRQALFFGFDRASYGSTVYAPNTPSVMPVPLDTKAYIQDPLYYSESPNHAAVLEDAGITEGTDGYIPERAIQLFEAALADYKVAHPDFTGPVTLKLISSDSDLSQKLANWVKSAYEKLFNTDPANPDKLVINVVVSTSTATSAAAKAWDFDLYLTALGFGASYGIQWQYAGIVYLGGLVAASFGLNIPYVAEDGVKVDLSADPESWIMAPLNIDLTTTYEYFLELGEDYLYETNEDGEDLHPGFIELYEFLKEDGDKPAGIYAGSTFDLAYILYALDTPYDGSAVAPFPGATQDVWNIIAAFEKVFFEQMPLIPTVTRSSATLYSVNVEILWPKYSSAFGWGPSRYRYLNTDADYEFGLYNAYEVAAANS